VGGAELIGSQPAPILRSIEIAVIVFVTSLLSSLIATGAEFPPRIAVIYAPALVAALAAVMFYAGARHIMIPPAPVPP
jgi:hypothetical protein